MRRFNWFLTKARGKFKGRPGKRDDDAKPEQKLEFGSLTEQRPTGQHRVSTWLADAFPKLIDDWNCDVVALEIERTFWEKATILRAESHRP